MVLFSEKEPKLSGTAMGTRNDLEQVLQENFACWDEMKPL